MTLYKKYLAGQTVEVYQEIQRLGSAAFSPATFPDIEDVLTETFKRVASNLRFKLSSIQMKNFKPHNIMKFPFAILYSITLLLVSGFTKQNPNAKTLILGSWEFDKMEFVGEYADVPKEEKDKVNNMNKGVMIAFFKDGKFQVKKKSGGKEKTLGDGNYQISTDGKILTMPLDGKTTESATILLITNERVKLGSRGKPNMLWKRSKITGN